MLNPPICWAHAQEIKPYNTVISVAIILTKLLLQSQALAIVTALSRLADNKTKATDFVKNSFYSPCTTAFRDGANFSQKYHVTPEKWQYHTQK